LTGPFTCPFCQGETVDVEHIPVVADDRSSAHGA
jgi:hypothetical protein